MMSIYAGCHIVPEMKTDPALLQSLREAAIRENYDQWGPIGPPDLSEETLLAAHVEVRRTLKSLEDLKCDPLLVPGTNDSNVNCVFLGLAELKSPEWQERIARRRKCQDMLVAQILNIGSQKEIVAPPDVRPAVTFSEPFVHRGNMGSVVEDGAAAVLSAFGKRV